MKVATDYDMEDIDKMEETTLHIRHFLAQMNDPRSDALLNEFLVRLQILKMDGQRVRSIPLRLSFMNSKRFIVEIGLRTFQLALRYLPPGTPKSEKFVDPNDHAATAYHLLTEVISILSNVPNEVNVEQRVVPPDFKDSVWAKLLELRPAPSYFLARRDIDKALHSVQLFTNNQPTAEIEESLPFLIVPGEMLVLQNSKDERRRRQIQQNAYFVVRQPNNRPVDPSDRLAVALLEIPEAGDAHFMNPRKERAIFNVPAPWSGYRADVIPATLETLRQMFQQEVPQQVPEQVPQQIPQEPTQEAPLLDQQSQGHAREAERLQREIQAEEEWERLENDRIRRERKESRRRSQQNPEEQPNQPDQQGEAAANKRPRK